MRSYGFEGCRLHFLYTKNIYLSPYLQRLVCNAIIQPRFDFACSPWYPNLNEKSKGKLQTIQNKCIDSRSHTGIKEFEQIIWLPVSERFKQYICSNASNFF